MEKKSVLIWVSECNFQEIKRRNNAEIVKKKKWLETGRNQKKN